MKEKEYDLFLDQADIERTLFSELIKLGYVPEEDEIEDLGEIVFDYFMEFLGKSGVVIDIQYIDVERDEE